MNRKERMYIIVTVVVVLLLVVKSFGLDPYKPANLMEANAIKSVEKIMEQTYNGWLYDYNVLVNKIVGIKALKSDDPMVVKYMESNTIDTFNVEGRFKVKVRKYVLGVLPIGEETVINIMENK